MNASPPPPASRTPSARANARVALVLAGLAFAVFCAVIVNHLPS